LSGAAQAERGEMAELAIVAEESFKKARLFIR
jgi:hypothetical protein